MEIAGAARPAALPESHKRLITRMPQPGEENDVRAWRFSRRFLQRAYRRPVTPAESSGSRSSSIWRRKNGGSFIEGIQVAVQAALCSPHFLFRWELDPRACKPGDMRELNDYEVASRLSYFLWSSMPDRELFDLAAKGELRKNGNLEKQVGAHAARLAGARAGRRISAANGCRFATSGRSDIDPGTFPNWNDELKGADEGRDASVSSRRS